MKAETDFGVFEMECGHPHAEGDDVALLLTRLPSGRGLQPATRDLRLRVEDVRFVRGQFKVWLGGGLVILMDEAPEIGSDISVTFRVECLGNA